MPYKLTSVYGKVTVEDIPVSAVVLPSVALTGAGVVTAMAPSLTFQEILLAPVALTGEGVFSAAVPALTQVSITLPSVALTGEGAFTAGAPVLTPQVISLPATAITGAGVVTAAVTRSWIPTDSAPRLFRWYRPEGAKYQESTRTTLQTGTGPVGSWTDESSSLLHASQATTGSRPNRRANGSIATGLTSSTGFMDMTAFGTWGADFLVGFVANPTSAASGNNPRMVSVDDPNGFALIQSPSDVLLVRPPAAGVSVNTWNVGVHTLLAHRSGTTMSVSVDGAAATTAGSAGGALTNNSAGLGYSPVFAGNVFVGHIHELIVIANPTAGDVTNLAGYLAARKASGAYT